jgi:formate hydrogenlyase subunit 4
MSAGWVNFLQGLFLILLAPGLVGLLRFIKARMLLRRRPLATILHPYWDLREAFRRPAVRCAGSSFIFALAPFLTLSTYCAAAFIIPLFSEQAFIRADIILLFFLLALARFSLSLAGVDSSSPFGWLGASREMFYQFFTEISFAFFLLGVTLRMGNPDLTSLASKLAGSTLFQQPVILLLALALANIILFEGGRIPVDNPSTHLELTMGHKASLLDYAGRDLAMLELAEMVKLVVLLALFSALFLPFGRGVTPPATLWALLVQAGLFLLKATFFLAGLASWELSQPKLRLRSIVQQGLTGIILSLLVVIYTLFAGQ